MILNIVYFICALIFGYFILIFIFDLLLRGFSPLLPSRPWVVGQIMSELKLEKEKPVLIAFSTGRSGFFHALEKKYPKADILGVEPSFFPFLISKLQSFIRRSQIKVVRQKINHVNVKNADLVYNHLYPDQSKGLGEKLKFECKPGTIVISTGFNIPDLEPEKIIDLPDRKGKLSWLSKNQSLFQRKSRKFKKEPKAYFYLI